MGERFRAMTHVKKHSVSHNDLPNTMCLSAIHQREVVFLKLQDRFCKEQNYIA